LPEIIFYYLPKVLEALPGIANYVTRGTMLHVIQEFQLSKPSILFVIITTLVLYTYV